MFGMVKSMLDENDNEKKDKIFSRVEKYEDISDNMEIEIANYLEQVGDAHLSDDSKAKIRSMMREISEIESIADACFKLARTLKRQEESGKVFTDKQMDAIHKMLDITGLSLAQMNKVMSGHIGDLSIDETFRIENEINAMRDKLKSENINAINNHEYDYAIGTIYSDIITDSERLGDYVVNVVEARFGKNR